MFFSFDENKKIGTVLLGFSIGLYILGILMFLDRACLMLSNVLFFIGFTLLAGFTGTLVFFGKKIKGSICFVLGLIFIVINIKSLGIILQLYGIYEFFKMFASKLFFWIEDWPIIGTYIKKLTRSNVTYTKKNDAADQV